MKSLNFKVGDPIADDVRFMGFIVGQSDERFVGSHFYTSDTGDELKHGFGLYYESYIVEGFELYNNQYCVRVYNNKEPRKYYFPLVQDWGKQD